MARPIKETVDYFPHSCNHHKTIFILENKFGNDGYAFWFKLLELLGSTKGHYLNYQTENESDWEFLQAKTNLDSNKCNQILDLLAKIDAIDKELWENRIVWSQNFVDGIADVYKNRRQEVPQKPSFYKRKPTTDSISTDNNPPNTGFSDQSTDKNRQTRVNKTRVNESKEKENPGTKKKFLDFVYLSDIEYKKLTDKFGKEKTETMIDNLNNYLGSKGKRYKSHYFTLLNWERMEKARQGVNNIGNSTGKDGHHDPNLIKDVIKEQLDYLEAEIQNRKKQYRIWFEKKYGEIILPVSANIAKGTSEKEGNKAYYLFNSDNTKKEFREIYLKSPEIQLKQPYIDLALKRLIENRGGLRKVAKFNSFELAELKKAYISKIKEI